MQMNEQLKAPAGARLIRLHVNGAPQQHAAAARVHLGDFVREQCGLTGTHLGCEHGVCGACTVLVDGRPVRSCITFAVSCEGKAVQTIEGYEGDPVMARLRSAFSQEHALQCGYCTPGMLATAYDIVRRLPDADEARVRLELSGNLCRCTGYIGIVRAIMSVLAAGRAGPASSAAQAAPAAPAPFQQFALADDSAPAAAQSVPGAPDLAGAASERQGWAQMAGSFSVDRPPEQVWAFMGDVEALAACLPGAEIVEHDGQTVKGRIAIRFGPISAAFRGAATLERDDAQRVGVLRGAGIDSISRSQAKGDITYRVTSGAEPGRTEVLIRLEHMLQGPLAQFSRSGLVRDFVARMIADFGVRVAARMDGADPALLAAPQLNGLGLAWSVVVARIRRIFTR
ncbi:MAG: aerobic carbon-monoxide dehydrogenase small subunit [Massilia sp.]